MVTKHRKLTKTAHCKYFHCYDSWAWNFIIRTFVIMVSKHKDMHNITRAEDSKPNNTSTEMVSETSFSSFPYFYYASGNNDAHHEASDAHGNLVF